MPIPIPKCDKCNTEMLLKDKNGEKFWGCPNWQRCKGKTKQYGGVDKPSPNAPQAPRTNDNGEVSDLARIELKIDAILDILKPNKPIPQSTNGDFQKLGDILPKYAETEIPIVEDGIDVKEIPF